MKKNIFLYVFVIASLCASFVSCEIGNDEEEFGEDLLNLSKETISAKWIPSDNSIYESIEFNENGQYFIIEKAQEERSAKNHTKTALGMLRSGGGSETVYCGTYQIFDDITIELSNYGTMKAYEITSKKLNGSILKEGEGFWNDFNSDKQPKMEDSHNNNLLCRTWHSQDAGIVCLIFTKSGDFYTISENDGDYFYDYGTWAWKTSETAFTMWFDHDNSFIEVVNFSIEVLTPSQMKADVVSVVEVDGETHTSNFILELFSVGDFEFPDPDKGPGLEPDPKPGIIYPIDILGTWECTYNIGLTRVDGELMSQEENTIVGTRSTFNTDGTLEQSNSFVGYWSLENNILTITDTIGYPVEFNVLALNNEQLIIECDMQLEPDGVEQVSMYVKIMFKKVVD